MSDDKNMSPADIKYSIWDTRTDENQTETAKKAAKAYDRTNRKKNK